jgi:transcription elongation factor
VNDDSTNNRMLRVVNGSGGYFSGIHDPIINAVVPAHTHTFTTGGISSDHTHAIQDPGHTHGVRDPGHSHGVSVRARNASGAGVGDSGDRVTYGTNTNSAGTGISIYHAGTGIWNGGVSSNHTHSGATDNGSSQTNWQPRYINLIICEKN